MTQWFGPLNVDGNVNVTRIHQLQSRGYFEYDLLVTNFFQVGFMVTCLRFKRRTFYLKKQKELTWFDLVVAAPGVTQYL